jgi:DNA primase
MKINGMSFPEAIRHLADKVGVILPERSLTSEDRKRSGVREALIGVNRLAVAAFGKTLFSTAGKRAWDYLRERGLSEEAIRVFRLGYAVDGWHYLRDHLQRERVNLQIAAQAGLLVAKEDGGFYDRFRGRLMFPIDDVNGRTVAFGGRLTGAGEPKYLNSPESPVYTKGRNLYGLSVTRESIRRKGYAIVVEGYFDLISLWNAGITNVVATLGTA